jgi:hypothetical protein
MKKPTHYLRIGKAKRLHIDVRSIDDIREVAHILREAAVRLRATIRSNDRYTIMRAEMVLAEASARCRVLELRNRHAVPRDEAMIQTPRLTDARRQSNNIKGVIS